MKRSWTLCKCCAVCHTYCCCLDYPAMNGGMTDEWLVEKNLKGSGCDLIRLLPWYLPRELRRTMENLSQDCSMVLKFKLSVLQIPSKRFTSIPVCLVNISFWLKWLFPSMLVLNGFVQPADLWCRRRSIVGLEYWRFLEYALQRLCIVGGGVQLCTLGMVATDWPIVPASDDYDDG
jgi:hypothetical protein